MRKNYTNPYITQYVSEAEFMELIRKFKALEDTVASGVDLSDYATIELVDDRLKEFGETDLSQYYDAEEINELIENVKAEIRSEIPSDYVVEEIQSKTGKAIIQNEVTGGGSKYQHVDGTHSYIGVNNGGVEGIGVQAYVKNSDSDVGTRINIYEKGAYYLPNMSRDDSGYKADDADYELVVKKDIANFVEKETYEAKIAELEAIIEDLSTKVEALKFPETSSTPEEVIGTVLTSSILDDVVTLSTGGTVEGITLKSKTVAFEAVTYKYEITDYNFIPESERSHYGTETATGLVTLTLSGNLDTDATKEAGVAIYNATNYTLEFCISMGNEDITAKMEGTLEGEIVFNCNGSIITYSASFNEPEAFIIDVDGEVYKEGYEDEVLEDPIFLDTNTMGEVEFGNPEDLTLETEDDKNYKAVGNLAEMTEEQSTAFWGDAQYAGSKYIAFKVRDISSENPVVIQGWVDSIESEDYKDSKTGSTAKGKNLAITLGETLRPELEGCYIWKCELTDGSIYTLDLTDQAYKIENGDVDTDEPEEGDSEESVEVDVEAVSALIEYIGAFGHVRVLNDFDKIFNDEEVEGLKLEDIDITDEAVTFKAICEDYGYDSVSEPRTVTGEVEISLTGSTEDDVFSATGWEMDGTVIFNNNGIKDGVECVLSEVKGSFDGDLEIIVVNGQLDIVDEDKTAGKFGAATEGTISCGGLTVSVTDIIS